MYIHPLISTKYNQISPPQTPIPRDSLLITPCLSQRSSFLLPQYPLVLCGKSAFKGHSLYQDIPKNSLCCVISNPYRFFNVTRCLILPPNKSVKVSGRKYGGRGAEVDGEGKTGAGVKYREYLSSGEKRAGWADLVTSAAWTFLRV